MKTKQTKRGSAFDAILNKRIEEALAEKQRNFPTEHEQDSEESLLQYLRSFSEELGRTPNSNEIIGGAYLCQRFGTWERALDLSGLPPPGRAADFKHRLIYKQERERQLILWREEKAKKQEEKKQRQLQKAERKAQKKDGKQEEL